MTRPFEPTADCPIPPFTGFRVTKLVPNCQLLEPPEPLFESDLLNFPLTMLPLEGFGCNCPKVNLSIENWTGGTQYYASSSYPYWDDYFDFIDGKDFTTGYGDSKLTQAAVLAGQWNQWGCGACCDFYCDWVCRVTQGFSRAYPLLGISKEQFDGDGAEGGWGLSFDTWNPDGPGRSHKGSWVVRAYKDFGPAWGRWETTTGGREECGLTTFSMWFRDDVVAPATGFDARAICPAYDPCDITLRMHLTFNLIGPPGGGCYDCASDQCDCDTDCGGCDPCDACDNECLECNCDVFCDQTCDSCDNECQCETGCISCDNECQCEASCVTCDIEPPPCSDTGCPCDLECWESGCDAGCDICDNECFCEPGCDICDSECSCESGCEVCDIECSCEHECLLACDGCDTCDVESGGCGCDNECLCEGDFSKKAIVETGTNYVGLACVESPRIVFADRVEFEMKTKSHKIPIDRIFIKTCERNSIRVSRISTNKPVPIGASVSGGNICLIVKEATDLVGHIEILGTRREFKGIYFPKYEREEMLRNNKFWCKPEERK